MFYPPFWIFFLITLILAGLTIWIKRAGFIDLQAFILSAAIAMSCDMLLCKQYDLYRYVNSMYRGWYSFWANIIIVPCFGLIFLKFAPKKKLWLTLYILAWSGIYTLIEIFILEPLKIIIYPDWPIFPYSTIGFVFFLSLLYYYYSILRRRFNNVR